MSEKDLAKARDGVNDLFEAIHLLDRVSDGIQQSVMDMRMLPIGPLFTRFHRVIRDMTRANGKEIRLDISGERTELDKRMIDELERPDDPHDPQLPPTTASSRPRFARPPESRSRARSRSAPSIAAAAS